MLSPSSSSRSPSLYSDTGTGNGAAYQLNYLQIGDETDKLNQYPSTVDIDQKNILPLTNVPFTGPHLVIREQPVEKFRFRYKSEMHGTHGSLTAIKTEKSKKSYPTVELCGYSGDALVRCSLYQTKSDRNLLHSHSLVVRKGTEDMKDPHTVTMSPTNGYHAVFQGMGIIHTAKKYIADELYQKLFEKKMFEDGRELTALEEAKLRNLSESEAKNMNLNQVCLCFEAYHYVNGQYKLLCDPIYSTSINNMKSALTGELKITRLSTVMGSTVGGDDLFLFVEKVGKKNIKVRFYEVDEYDDVIWEDWGRFTEADVHHQYAIALKTPPYRTQDVDKPVNVLIQLFRPSDQDQSEPVKFRYKSNNCLTARKRQRMNSTYSSAEMPSVLPQPQYVGYESQYDIRMDAPPSISNEYDKIRMIEEVSAYPQTSSMTSIPSTEFRSFIEYLRNNSDEMAKICMDDYLKMDGVSVSIQSNSLIEPQMNTSSIANEQWYTKLLRTIQEQPKIAPIVIRKLVQRTNAENENILHLIVGGNNSKSVISELLTVIKQLNLIDCLQWTNNQNETPLHYSCIFNKPVYTKLLIESGANVNSIDNDGNTALHIAVKSQYYDCITELLRRENYRNGQSIDLDIINDDGLTALHLAVRTTNIDIIEQLLNGGASITVTEQKHGNNILHMAVERGSTKIVRFLMEHTQIDSSQTNNSGHTPLYLANVLPPDNPGREIIELLTKKEQKVDIGGLVTVKNEPIEPLFDSYCQLEMCTLFNKSNEWKRLAGLFGFDDSKRMVEWSASPNPSKLLFEYMVNGGVTISQLCHVLSQNGYNDALCSIDAMIGRKLEGHF